MGVDPAGLSDEERAELEELRAEKRRREEAAMARQERAELDRLRAQRAKDERETQESRRIQELRDRNARLMEPDEDDLKMPVGQKVVLVAVLAIAVIAAMVMALTR
ncbi:hypothetical protein [Olsenella urininfantis]|uniref:hypothetical protein n=1 Tax=Olsenella urininfantis TaxID=1871033 RepID=UPI0009860576|nr:hypothetical protein [Olsenella urininfantis]